MPKTLIILGSTGSIGAQTLEVVRRFRREFTIVGLAGGENWQLLLRQIQEFKPKFAAVKSSAVALKLRKKTGIQIFSGEAGFVNLAGKKTDLVVSALAGAVGLAPTLAALSAGHDVALANKESLALAGELVMRTARKSGAKIFPIDSEHSGVWQLLHGRDMSEVQKVILTASGGALRDWPLARLKSAKVRDVLAHPNWDMGAKVTVDSATLANKALEVIEANQLFGIPIEKIEAVIHPQSLVHALIEWTDGSVTAQLAEPDMRLPIQLALFGGKHERRVIKRFDLTKQLLEFRPVDLRRYPLFGIILAAARQSEVARATVALAAERATELFLAGELKFLDQINFVKQVLREIKPKGNISLKKLDELQLKIETLKKL